MAAKSYYAVRVALRLLRAARRQLKQQATPSTSTTRALPAVGGRAPYGLARTGHVNRSGNFVRTRRPRPKPKVEKIPKLPPAGPALVPKQFKSVSVPANQAAAAPGAGGAGASGAGAGGASSSSSNSSSYLSEWFKANGAILILNFGSVCTLVGFTRQDILELRALSMTGSIASVLYFALSRPAFAPMAWSSLFAATNAFKIARIIDERKGNVVLSEHEEDIYEEHFLSHGVTPKQYAKLLQKAEVIDAKKGDKIVSAGERIDKVYLVVAGQTRASFLGRRVTAASSAPGNQVALRGGDAGAWIGETAFLDWYWNKEKVKTKKKKKDEEEEDFDDDEEDAEPVSNVGLAIHTIVASTDDCELLCWTHKDLEELMHKSADLRSALTRSMTAAIVGKVVNLTVSRSVGTLPTWSTWLDDWKHSGGAKVNVASEGGQPQPQPQPTVSTVERQHTDNPVKIANKVVKEQIAGN
mmetsp:Transcript_20664/g.42174  ORF Transcript_20664/g.42174 Transcript_20664/m.42174 type:complete len:469 (+) Transcript_20664:374-1780(+)